MTVIVKLFVEPVQPFADGVTTIPATVGSSVPFSPVKDGILPVPEPASPMLALLFVQVKLVPATVPVLFTVAVGAPLQTTWFDMAAAFGVGLTV